MQLLETIKVFSFGYEDVNVGQSCFGEPHLTHEEVGTVVQLFAQRAESDDFSVAFRVMSFNQ